MRNCGYLDVVASVDPDDLELSPRLRWQLEAAAEARQTSSSQAETAAALLISVAHARETAAALRAQATERRAQVTKERESAARGASTYALRTTWPNQAVDRILRASLCRKRHPWRSQAIPLADQTGLPRDALSCRHARPAEGATLHRAGAPNLALRNLARSYGADPRRCSLSATAGSSVGER